jgi:carboxyl-terminal processing protease
MMRLEMIVSLLQSMMCQKAMPILLKFALRSLSRIFAAIAVPQISDPDFALRQKYQTRESDLRGHLINELGIKDEEMEADRIADPRFQLTAVQLEQQGVKDFQLHYAMETLRRTTRSTVALRPVTRPARR